MSGPIYEDKETEILDNGETPSDDKPDIPDSEEILRMLADSESDILDGEKSKDNYSADVNYVYYKSDGVNINIYHKQTEIEKEQLASNPDTDYDFLRVEVQVKKNKFNALVRKLGLNGRELQYLVHCCMNIEVISA